MATMKKLVSMGYRTTEFIKRWGDLPISDDTTNNIGVSIDMSRQKKRVIINSRGIQQ